MIKLPAIYFPELFDRQPEQLSDGLSWCGLEKLVEELDEAGVMSPAASTLLNGQLWLGQAAPGALLVLGDCRVQIVARWAELLGARGFASLVGCALSNTGTRAFLQAEDAPVLLGHGLVVASRGITGQPMVGMELSVLRQELSESREKLSQMAGYPINILMPELSITGRAVDGLVLSEAKAAGYKVVLEPGGRVSALDENGPAGSLPSLNYRRARSDDSPTELLQWVLAKRFSRPKAVLDELLRSPRRILSRFRL